MSNIYEVSRFGRVIQIGDSIAHPKSRFVVLSGNSAGFIRVSRKRHHSVA